MPFLKRFVIIGWNWWTRYDRWVDSREAINIHGTGMNQKYMESGVGSFLPMHWYGTMHGEKPFLNSLNWNFVYRY